MKTTIIPIQQSNAQADALAQVTIPETLAQPTGLLLDSFNRNLKDLRISITDRCNFRCPYCMPKEIFGNDYPYMGHKELLSFEEIRRFASIFIGHGVEKIRLTGGEPLLRKGVEDLVGMLAELKTHQGKPIDLTLTTNGSLLSRKAAALKAAGLKRITVSLDGINDAVFRQMNDVDFPVSEVLQSIETAHAVGFQSIKVNMVVKKGMNDQEIIPMVKHFKGTGIIPRFIEYMDVGNSNDWKMDEVLPSAEVIQRIHEVFPLEPIESAYAGEVAQRWRFKDQSGEIGVISSVTQAFCHSCTRARLSMEGKLYLCLFATAGYDLKQFIRGDYSDLEISNLIQTIWQQRNNRYSELRSQQSSKTHKVEMSYIGG